MENKRDNRAKFAHLSDWQLDGLRRHHWNSFAVFAHELKRRKKTRKAAGRGQNV